MLSRSWVFLTVPYAILAIGLLTWTAMSLVRTVRKSVVASVPIRAEQRIAFNESGEFALNFEGKLLSSAASGLRYSILDASGATIPLDTILFRTKSSSFSRARVELHQFELRSPGTFVLRIEGLDPNRDYRANAIVFTRRFTLSLVLHILALVILGATFIGALVVTGLALTGRQPT